MPMWSRIWKTLRGDRHSAEIREEIEFHQQMLDREEAARGQAQATRLRIGNRTQVAEETRAAGIVQWLDSTFQDARYGIRQLRKTPLLSWAVVLSLAIGIGANTAIFSLVDAAILKPLPVPDPDRLVIVQWTNQGGWPDGVNGMSGDSTGIESGVVRASSVSAGLYRTLAAGQAGFEELVGIADPRPATVAIGASPAEQVSLQYVSSNFFQGIGAAPALGRPFRDEEDRAGEAPVVIVSRRFWQNRLGSSREAIGQTIRVNNVPAQVVGVAPAGFFGLRAGRWIDVYAPLAARAVFIPEERDGGPWSESPGYWWVRLVGRLKDGVPAPAATAQTLGLFQSLVAELGGDAEPEAPPELVTFPGARGFDALQTNETDALWILTLLVGLLLLIVCANVANLLLSRSVGRQRESSVRLALGAARLRLFRQHLIESGLFALLGGAAGLGLGYVLAHGMHDLFQAGADASRVFDLRVDLRILAFTAAISVVTAFVFGLAPALRSAASGLDEALRSQTRSVTAGRLRLPKLLVSLQIALCLTGLFAAGLLARSLQNLMLVDVGFARENLVYATVNPRQAGYEDEQLAGYEARVRERIAAIPGVVGVSPIENRFLTGGGDYSIVNLPGRPVLLSENGFASSEFVVEDNHIGDGLLETLGIPLVAGRTFTPRDMQPESNVVVVDEGFVRKFFPNESPIGRRMGFNPNEADRYEIVGVARDTRSIRIRGTTLPSVYRPYVAPEAGGPMHFAIRAGIDSGRLAEAVRGAIAAVDPSVPLTEFQTQTGLIDGVLRTERLLAFVSGAFGLVALTLAAVGLGGLLAYAVARRTNEIGIRMALGAASKDVVRMVLRDMVWMLGAGIVLGIPGAYAIGTILEASLFELEPLDPWTAAFSLAALIAVALIAAWLPARRAVAIDPVTALREE